jgi:hypothetical protein
MDMVNITHPRIFLVTVLIPINGFLDFIPVNAVISQWNVSTLWNLFLTMGCVAAASIWVLFCYYGTIYGFLQEWKRNKAAKDPDQNIGAGI